MREGNETNRERFVRLAESRTNAILEKIRVLANCANPYAYEYTEQDVREIFGAIEQGARRARAKFQNGHEREQSEFRLSARGESDRPLPATREATE